MYTVISLGPIENNSNGYSIRIGHLIKSLMRHGDVTLIEFHISEPKGGGETEYSRVEYDAVLRNGKGRSMLTRLITFNPFGQLKMQLVALKGIWRNRKLIRGSEAVFIEGALFPSAIVLAKAMDKKVVLDTHCVNYKLGMDFKNHNRAAYALRCITWGPLEYFAYKLSDKVVFVSDAEVDFSENALHLDRGKAIVIPNVLDIKPLTVTPEAVAKFKGQYGLNNKVVATFVGDLTSVQNKDCVDFILNQLAEKVEGRRKDIAFLIVGKGKESFQNHPGNVIFTGYVDDIDPVIAATDVFVAPLRVGAGTKTKVLLFMAYGVPILTTEVGVEGISVQGRDDIMVEELADFPAALESFTAGDRSVRGSSTASAEAYSPEVMQSRVESLLKELNGNQ